MHHVMDDFHIAECAMPYSLFVPRLYNYCLSVGFERARMMPSRAFCSDESQGYPVILLMQHFGTFPFDHGHLGGKVAIDRHGPHASHGEDLVIVQASHVGYDPVTERFGIYQRRRRTGEVFGENCGKLSAILRGYQAQYETARCNIFLGVLDDKKVVFIDNHLLRDDRADGLILHLDRLIAGRRDKPLKVLSTSKVFEAASSIVDRLPADVWSTTPKPIAEGLTADLFIFNHTFASNSDEILLEAALLPIMPALVTSPYPALDAARYTTQVEFDRTFRSMQNEPAYNGKNLLFIAGLNIDVSPAIGAPFPLTKFVPWAAYLQCRDGRKEILEQDQIFEKLLKQSSENKDKLSFEAAFNAIDTQQIEVRLDMA
jgi:hypothetical protein